MTDHRIKHTSHQLADVLAGGEELDDFIDRLNATERSQQLAEEARRSRRGPRRWFGEEPITWSVTTSTRRWPRPNSCSPACSVPIAPGFTHARNRCVERGGEVLRPGAVPAVHRRADPTPHGGDRFRHLVLTVRPGVFVPRPETEIVVDAAVEACCR